MAPSSVRSSHGGTRPSAATIAERGDFAIAPRGDTGEGDELSEAPTAGARAWLLWASLAVAFSPTLLDLGRHVAAEPWAGYVALFPLLFVQVARRMPHRAPRRAAGLAWIAAGVALELLAIGSGEIRFGRVGLVPAAIGACLWQGYGQPANRALLVGIVPLPSFVADAASPALGSSLLALAPLFAGLAWARSLALGRGAAAAAARVLAAVALAVAGQGVAIAGALGLAALAGDEVAHAALGVVPWIAAGALGLAWVERALRADAR